MKVTDKPPGKRLSVFLSYAHESDVHTEKVYGLAASLRREGFEVLIDIEKSTGEDWPLWMQRQLMKADFVLCVCTEEYLSRFDHNALPNVGLGVGWEGGLIRRMLYESKLENKKIFPVYFSDDQSKDVPIALSGYDRFVLKDTEDYVAILRKLKASPQYQLPPATDTEPTITLQTKTVEPLFSAPADQLKKLAEPEPNAYGEPEESTVHHEHSVEGTAQVFGGLLNSLTLLGVAAGVLAVWGWIMSLLSLTILGLLLFVVLILLEKKRRTKTLSEWNQRWIRGLRLDSPRMKGMSAVILAGVVVLTSLSTSIYVDALPTASESEGKAKSILVKDVTGTLLRTIARGDQQFLFCPPWGRTLQISAANSALIQRSAFPWVPFHVNESFLKPWIRIAVRCSDDLLRALPRNPNEPKATIRITCDDKELHFGEFSGRMIVLTNDAGKETSSENTVVVNEIPLEGTLSVQVNNAAGGIMVGPVAFKIEKAQSEIVLPGP